MKLTEKLKEKINSYFDNITSEELVERLNKYKISLKMENNKYNLGLNNFILYCKNWYQCVDDRPRLQRYKDILKMDGFEYCNSYKDVLTILSRKIDFYNDWLIEHDKKNEILTLSKLLQTFSHVEIICYDEELSFEEKLIIAIRDWFAWNLDKDVIIKPPHYDKKLRKLGYVLWTDNGVTYKQMNKHVKGYFS